MAHNFASKADCLDAIEAMLDAGHTPDMIVEMLADVCGEKEQHVLTNWQDRGLAAVWRKHANAVQEASAKLTKLWINYPAW